MNKIVPFERNVEYLHRRAMLGRREGRLLDALALFRRAVEREPATLKYHMDMAETLCEMGCYVESNRVLAGMLAHEDAPDDCYFGLCCNYFGMNELEKAYRAMVQFLAHDPEAMERDEVSNMFKNLVLMRALNGTKNRRMVRVTRLLTQANEKLKRGELAAVEAFSRRVLSLDPKRQIACVMLAQALLEQGRAGEARQAIARALHVGKPDARVLGTAVRVYLAAGDRAAAQAAYARMKPAPEDARGWRYLVEAACALGDDERVRALLPRALRDAPYDRALLHMCAVNRVREGCPAEQALSFWTRMLLIDPSDPVARHYARKAEQDELDLGMTYEYALPFGECARRIEALKRAQWLSDAQLNEAWRGAAFQALISWGVRGSERQGMLLAQALLKRIDGFGARSLMCEGMLDRGVGAPDAEISLSIGETGVAAMSIGMGQSGVRVPVRLRKAMKMAISMAQSWDGNVSAAVVRLVLMRLTDLRSARPSDAASWAAALLYQASSDAGHAISLAEAAALMGCPTRRAARCARMLTR